MMRRNMSPSYVLFYALIFMVAVTAGACAQASIRRLPIADDMPATPAGAEGVILGNVNHIAIYTMFSTI